MLRFTGQYKDNARIKIDDFDIILFQIYWMYVFANNYFNVYSFLLSFLAKENGTVFRHTVI